jgi:plastocyanin
METKRARSYIFLFLIAVAVFLAVTPAIVSAKTYKITIRDEGFDPDSLTIEVGDTVKWVVKSGIAHTMVPGNDHGGTCEENLNYTFMSNNETFSYTFNTPQTCYYTCPLHGAGMDGVIYVKEKKDAGTNTTTTTVK